MFKVSVSLKRQFVDLWKLNLSVLKNKKVQSETEIALGELFQDENDNPFLQAWGRPGRENISLLNQWSEWNYEPWFVEYESATAQDKDSRKSTSQRPPPSTAGYFIQGA